MMTAKWPALIDAQFSNALQRLFLDEISLSFYAVSDELERIDSAFDMLRNRGRRLAESMPTLRQRPREGSAEDLLAWAREAVRALVEQELPSIVSRTASRLNRYVRLEISVLLNRQITGTPFEIDMRIADWIETNTRLIRSVDFTSNIGDIIREEFTKGSSISVIKEALEKRADLSRSKANLIAVDQTGKLYSQLTEYRHREQGIYRARWITKRDSRVRPSHRRMHGIVFDWNDLPEVDGEKTAPGRPIMCRCVAEPVSSLSN